jgi:hypothetical protein
MDLDSFLVSLYVLIEDWWKAAHYFSNAPRVGRPSLISDAEILALAVLAQWPRFRSERDFWRFAQAHLRDYFPTLPSQSQFNRRMRALQGQMSALQEHLARELSGRSEIYHILDTTLIAAVVRVRACRKGLFAGEATFGRCVSKTEWIYGFKVGLTITPEGVITTFCLAEAAADERPIGDVLIRRDGHGAYLADKGFSSVDWERRWLAEYGALVAATPKDNSRRAWSEADRRWASGKRQIIEGGYKPAQGSVLSGAPQGKDPWWSAGSLGGQDRRLHLRAAAQRSARSPAAPPGRSFGLRSYASAVSVFVLTASEGSSGEPSFGLRRQAVYSCCGILFPARQLEFSGSGPMWKSWDTTSYRSSYRSTDKLAPERTMHLSSP